MELFVDEVAGGGTRERAFCLEQQEPNQMAINWKENKELLVTDVAWWLLPGTPFITVPKKEKRKKKRLFKTKGAADNTKHKTSN